MEKTAVLTYEILNSTDSRHTDYASFILSNISSKPAILTDKLFDYETNDEYSFEVLVRDSVNQRTNKALVVVNIIDVNDNPPEIVTNNLIYNITEGTRLGSIVASLHATDKDEGINSQVVFTAIGGDGTGVFTVATDGTVLLSSNLDANIKKPLPIDCPSYR